MENSFIEYRDSSRVTGVESDSESEFIDNSLMDESTTLKKTPGKKNQTAFIPESDNSTEEETEEDNSSAQVPKTVSRKRATLISHEIVISSDDEKSRRGSFNKLSHSSNKMVFSSSEDEGELSPEIIPRRRVPSSSKSSSNSFIGHKTKKRIMRLDSDTENSIIIEHDRNKKLACFKDTPLKIDNLRRNIRNIKNMSIQSNDSIQSSDEDQEECDKLRLSDEDSSDSKDKNIKKKQHSKEEVSADDTYCENVENNDSDCDNRRINISEGDDEDQIVMSRATRMSIMGAIPKENDSDDSDYIQSDDTPESSRRDSLVSLSEPPVQGPEVLKTPEKDDDVGNSSQITCSPLSSPLRDITKEVNNSKNDSNISNKTDNSSVSLRSVFDDSKGRSFNSSTEIKMIYKEKVIDEDLTMIDAQPEVIALSSDDDEIKDAQKSPNIKKSSKVKTEEKRKTESDIKKYFVPQSYPNQVVYVKKHVRENELNKLNGLKEDLKNIRYVLESMDVNTLPDGGMKLIERLTVLEEQTRLQGDKVANMVVEPDVPTATDIAKDGFGIENKGLSWDEIQRANNAVQPRMFGKQAMATHMAERTLIQERLRSLYESLASRPAVGEGEGANGGSSGGPGAEVSSPAALRSRLMPHQLHALTWLRWRETQRPAGGILADDMGLGKTITMIALVLGDKETSIDNDDDDFDDENVDKKTRLVRGGTLVVCPASLVQQWADEVRRHCAAHALSVGVHHGAARATQPARLAAHDLVVTTYHVVQREQERGAVARVAWRRLVLDEAHAVRNHKSATAGAVCALVARRRWALTGTPLHNKDLDVYALLKFLKCTPFDDLKMWQKWIDNKSLGGQERLAIIMRCLLLRRTKAQLQQQGQLQCLPQRSLHHVDVTLDKEEMTVYQKVLVFSKTLFAQFLHQRAEKHSGVQESISSNKDSEYFKMHKKMIALQGAKPVKSHEILVLLLRLRQVCCHCGLIAAMLDERSQSQPDTDVAEKDLLAELDNLTIADRRKSGGDDDEEDKNDSEGTTAAEAIRSVLSPNNPVFNLENQSSKIKAVMKCLNENVFPYKERKAVVVSQWTGVLALLARALAAAGVRGATLSGAVPVPARGALVRDLNDARSGLRVMLLSLCAGGVGLNLCGASHLLLLDPHWNPQLEEQAQDRVYRLGQTQHVHIYKFMCVDTVEQSIRQLQKAKLALADSVLTGAKNNNGSKLTIEDLKLLFNMGPQSEA